MVSLLVAFIRLKWSLTYLLPPAPCPLPPKILELRHLDGIYGALVAFVAQAAATAVLGLL